MGSRGNRKKMNVDGDRLSSLPDDLIHKILSFMGLKHAIQTSALSSRWRYIWTSMPCLDFSSKDFVYLPKFSKFVQRVLSDRNNELEVSSVKLTFPGKVSQGFVRRILDYAFSHYVQQLSITCLSRKEIELPLSIFSSRSLKHLTLTGYGHYYTITTPPTWELPVLATLNLHCVTLYDDKGAGLFSNCANLKNLTINNCGVGLNGFTICHPGLSSLTLDGGCVGINVDTPQLNNLTVNYCGRIRLISAPNLSSLCYKDSSLCSDDDLLQLSTHLHLEKVDLCINQHLDCRTSTYKIVGLLEQLHSVKFLTLNLELAKLLSSSVELISNQPSPFVNLKSLKIYPANVTKPEVTMSTEVKNYLLDGSPCATLTVVSHEEIRAVMNVVSARNLMGELQVLLEQWKESSETNTSHVKQDMAPMTTGLEQVEAENHSAQRDTKMKCHFQERMEHIESYWQVQNKQFKKGYKNTRRTISLLRKIEEVLAKLPTSDRAKLQARFSGLCADAETIMDNVKDRVKFHCDKKQSRSSFPR